MTESTHVGSPARPPTCAFEPAHACAEVCPGLAVEERLMTKKRALRTEVSLQPVWLGLGVAQIQPPGAVSEGRHPQHARGLSGFSAQQRAQPKRVQSFASRRRNK